MTIEQVHSARVGRGGGGIDEVGGQPTWLCS